jgi:hypothetical protein
LDIRLKLLNFVKKTFKMTKHEQIFEIKKLIRKHGSKTSFDLELESSPCISSKGNGRNNISELIESFYLDTVEVVTYHGENPIDYNEETYEDLSEDIIDEIYNIMQSFDVLLEKTYKRCE